MNVAITIYVRVIFLAQLSRIYSDWWISKWTTFAFEALNGDRYNYIYVYAGLIGLFAVLVQLRGSLFYGWSLTASTVIHNRTF